MSNAELFAKQLEQINNEIESIVNEINLECQKQMGLDEKDQILSEKAIFSVESERCKF